MTEMPGRPRNPYRPGAALSPLFLAGRSAEERRFRSTLDAAPELPANVRLTGLRGVGKTVLLKAFQSAADEELGWLTSRLQLEPRHNTDDGITRLLISHAEQARERASRAARVRGAVGRTATRARGSIKIRYDELEVTLDPSMSASQRTLSKELYETAETADDKGYAGYLLLLDEAQVLRDETDRGGQHPLSLLIAAVNALQEHEVPLGLVLCGLPTLRTNLLKARTYSERMFRGEEIGSLTAAAAGAAFSRPLDRTGVRAEEDLVARVVREVEGYPYFIQLWGAELWDAARDADIDVFTTDLLDAIEPEIYRRLDADFYDARVDALTPAEQDVLIMSAACPYPPLRTADLRKRSSKSEGNINVLMGRLVEQGVLYREQKGQYAYTAPRFHDYLKRRAAGRA